MESLSSLEQVFAMCEPPGIIIMPMMPMMMMMMMMMKTVNHKELFPSSGHWEFVAH